ncbi:MAG: hypothetical protein R3C62_18135 [Chloroflexota bacterium]
MNAPVLARAFEAAGISTLLVTMMPYWAEKTGTPRTLGVEFPFGQTLGQPHNVAQQQRVIAAALELLASAAEPGTIAHLDEQWPIDQKTAYKTWQPSEASPIIAHLAPRIRDMMRQSRQ